MGRNAQIKKARREERRLLERHPERRCGFMHVKRNDKGEPVGKPKRCEYAGRWSAVTESGQRTFDAKTHEARTDPGKVYACNFHASMFRANGLAMKRIA